MTQHNKSFCAAFFKKRLLCFLWPLLIAASWSYCRVFEEQKIEFA
jgi:hypothetical protein